MTRKVIDNEQTAVTAIRTGSPGEMISSFSWKELAKFYGGEIDAKLAVVTVNVYSYYSGNKLPLASAPAASD